MVPNFKLKCPIGKAGVFLGHDTKNEVLIFLSLFSINFCFHSHCDSICLKAMFCTSIKNWRHLYCSAFFALANENSMSHKKEAEVKTVFYGKTCVKLVTISRVLLVILSGQNGFLEIVIAFCECHWIWTMEPFLLVSLSHK